MLTSHTHSRYLLVNAPGDDTSTTHETLLPEVKVPVINLDPRHWPKFAGMQIQIPQVAYKLDRLLNSCKINFVAEEYDEEDSVIFGGCQKETFLGRTVEPQAALDDWAHDPVWVEACVQHMSPPPVDATRMAVTTLQREVAAMLKEQGSARSRKELGWYMPQAFISDNLFQWIVELHSFDSNLPIAQDLRTKQVIITLAYLLND